jgi:copper chaperone CopZ
MDKTCHVETIRKINASVEQIQRADHATLSVQGMGCENCVTRVRNSLMSTTGVYGVELFLNLKLAEIKYDSRQASVADLIQAVARAGNDGRHEYRAELISAE